jgi:DNA-binding CsgD family transcriptional regulator
MQTHHSGSARERNDQIALEVGMEILEDVLDRVSRSGEAVFAIDGGNRITFWNKACEKLVGRPARHVLGKRCWEIMRGRDGNGNVYCTMSCPVAHQVRDLKEDPVHPFLLGVQGADGAPRRISVSLFAVPSYQPALTSVVHVLRPAAEEATVPAAPEPVPVVRQAETFNGNAAALTSRENQILGCLARGLSTAAIANELSIARVTVRNHIQSVLQRLGVHSKLEAVVEARRMGIA